ncbi:hypothetical protein [Micromonospora sp. NPDC005173]|uniref:hypothetical protein n=1 Tax=Micromonospora sp. NPDC005173 TaxID=3157165 RepID=UPI0033A8EC0D
MAAASLIEARLQTIAFQLRDVTTEDGQEIIPFQGVSKASMAAASLLAYQILSMPDPTGQPADASLLREPLRGARRFLGDAPRSYDRLAAYLKGRGFTV